MHMQYLTASNMRESRVGVGSQLLSTLDSEFLYGIFKYNLRHPIETRWRGHTGLFLSRQIYRHVYIRCLALKLLYIHASEVLETWNRRYSTLSGHSRLRLHYRSLFLRYSTHYYAGFIRHAVQYKSPQPV